MYEKLRRYFKEETLVYMTALRHVWDELRPKGSPTAQQLSKLSGVTDLEFIEKAIVTFKSHDAAEKKTEWHDSLEEFIENEFKKASDAPYMFKIERPAVKMIAGRIKEFPESKLMATLMIETLSELCKSRDKFWSTKPVLPSTLRSEIMFVHVMNLASKRRQVAATTPKVMSNIIEGVFDERR